MAHECKGVTLALHVSRVGSSPTWVTKRFEVQEPWRCGGIGIHDPLEGVRFDSSLVGSSPTIATNGFVAKLVHAARLERVSERTEGSTPSEATKLKL